MGEKGQATVGFRAKHIIEQCNARLKRLRVGYVDLWQCHRYDAETPIDETLRAIDDLCASPSESYCELSSQRPGRDTHWPA